MTTELLKTKGRRRFRSGKVHTAYLAAGVICAVLILLTVMAILSRTAKTGGTRVAATPKQPSQSPVHHESSPPSPSQPPTHSPAQPPSRTQPPPSPAQAEEVEVLAVINIGSPTPVPPPPQPTSPQQSQKPTASAQGRKAYPDGRPHEIKPEGLSRIQAEDFDLGGEGVGYHSLKSANNWGYRPNEAVHTEPSQDIDNQVHLSNIKEGEWTEYTLRVQRAGAYSIRLRTANASGGSGRARLRFNGEDKTGVIAIPDTGDWMRFVDLPVGNVELPAGEQVMRLEMLSSGFNVNWIDFGPAGNFTPNPIEDAIDALKVGAKLPETDGWSHNLKGGSAAVQEMAGIEGKCLRLADTNPNQEVWVKHTFTPQRGRSGVVVEAKLRFAQVTDGMGFHITRGDTLLVQIEVDKGQLAVKKTDKDWRNLQALKPNTWITVRFDLNLKDGKYNVLIDGAQKAEGLPVVQKADQIDSWRVGSSGPAKGTMYIGDVKIMAR